MMEHHVTHPFSKHKFIDGTYQWVIGCDAHQDRMGGDYYVAHGEGKKVITEISRHTPPGYGEKVFFTVKYVDPDGKQMGVKRLKMLGVKAFERRISGFVGPLYDIEDCPDD